MPDGTLAFLKRLSLSWAFSAPPEQNDVREIDKSFGNIAVGMLQKAPSGPHSHNAILACGRPLESHGQ